jgi:hypothetical protein
MAARDAKGLTLGLRLILRLHIEMRDACGAGERIGLPLTIKEAITSPHALEQAAYLDIFARRLLERYPDEDEILGHLDSMISEDLDMIEKIHEEGSKCSNCGKALCVNCGVCHPCDQVDENHVSKKKPFLN